MTAMRTAGTLALLCLVLSGCASEPSRLQEKGEEPRYDNFKVGSSLIELLADPREFAGVSTGAYASITKPDDEGRVDVEFREVDLGFALTVMEIWFEKRVLFEGESSGRYGSREWPHSFNAAPWNCLMNSDRSPYLDAVGTKTLTLTDVTQQELLEALFPNEGATVEDDGIDLIVRLPH